MDPEKCSLHSGRKRENKDQRRRLDLSLYRLPENSAGKVGGKKCTYCAYLLGIKSTITAVEKALKIGQFPKGRNDPVQDRNEMIPVLGALYDNLVDDNEWYEKYLSDYVDKRFPDLEENEREEWIKNHARK